MVKNEQPGMTVEGYDPSIEKIKVARQSAIGIASLSFRGPESPPQGKGLWDVVAIVDVLYLLSPASKELVLTQCCDLLKPGGTLLIKEVNTRPLLKYAWAFFAEWVAIHLVGWTLGQGLYFESMESLVNRLKKRSLSIQTVDLGSGWWHPHMLLIALKPKGIS